MKSLKKMSSKFSESKDLPPCLQPVWLTVLKLIFGFWKGLKGKSGTSYQPAN